MLDCTVIGNRFGLQSLWYLLARELLVLEFPIWLQLELQNLDDELRSVLPRQVWIGVLGCSSAKGRSDNLCDTSMITP